jgi:ankyrin repeat protein
METYLQLLHRGDLIGLNDYLEVHDVDKEIYGQSLLYWAVFHNSLGFSKYLITRGADINRKDKLGRTPLLCASYFGFLDIVQYLLDCGADVTIRDNADKSPLQRAEDGWDGHMHSEIVELLKRNSEK